MQIHLTFIHMKKKTLREIWGGSQNSWGPIEISGRKMLLKWALQGK